LTADTPAFLLHQAGILRSRGLDVEITHPEPGCANLEIDKINGAGQHCVFTIEARQTQRGRWDGFRMGLVVDDEDVDLAGGIAKALRILGKTNPDGPAPGGPATSKSNQALATKKNTVIRV
jgi:hypothetical protein